MRSGDVTPSSPKVEHLRHAELLAGGALQSWKAQASASLVCVCACACYVLFIFVYSLLLGSLSPHVQLPLYAVSASLLNAGKTVASER